jgi:hypothetical protein
MTNGSASLSPRIALTAPGTPGSATIPSTDETKLTKRARSSKPSEPP